MSDNLFFVFGCCDDFHGGAYDFRATCSTIEEAIARAEDLCIGIADEAHVAMLSCQNKLSIVAHRQKAGIWWRIMPDGKPATISMTSFYNCEEHLIREWRTYPESYNETRFFNEFGDLDCTIKLENKSGDETSNK